MFNKKSLKFLNDLRNNNNREWFNDNKDLYEDCVRTPALNFIEDMQPHIKKLSPHFNAIAKKVGGSMMRPYRDTRFSKDKTPYKTNVGIQFRHALAKDVHAPGYYFHISEEECFLAAGIWRPESKALRKIRELIDEAPSAWNKIKTNKAFNQGFELSGESLMNGPRGFAKDHKNLEDLKRKDFIAVTNFDHNELYQEDLATWVAKRYKAADPLMKFLCEALEINF